MELEAGTAILVADEAIDLAIGVARDVLQRAAAIWLLGQPMNGHDREELVDRPAVGERLEYGEIAEISVDECRVEVHDDVVVLVAALLHGARDGVDRCEIDLFGHGAPAQR